MSHDSINSNFVNAFVLSNPIFIRGPGNKQSLTLSFLELPETGFSPLANLKARDFFNVNGIKRRQELAFDCDLNLSLTGYADLVRCLNHYVRRLKPNTRNNGSSTTLLESVGLLKNRIKKLGVF
jgi:hypothetical protein